MNTVAELISKLESKGVRFYRHTGALRVDAPQGTLTDDLRAILAERKPAIVAFLRAKADVGDQSYNTKRLELASKLVHLFNERASILEFEVKIPRVEAERMARLETQSTSQFRQWQGLLARSGCLSTYCCVRSPAAACSTTRLPAAAVRAPGLGPSARSWTQTRREAGSNATLPSESSMELFVKIDN